MKRLYIIRGLPGSGKSHAVKEIVDQARNYYQQGVVVCSADDFFMVNGEYQFNPMKIAQAHMHCQVKALNAMAEGTELVIIDNTNTQKWEFKLYEEMADIFDYQVGYKMIGTLDSASVQLYAERNIHGVPLEAIQRMAERFEE